MSPGPDPARAPSAHGPAGGPAGRRPGRGLPRAADLALAAAGLLLGSPLLLAAAVAIKLDSRGPVLYRQPRVGRGGEVFELLKLRTMHRGSDPAGVGTAVTAGDPRVTRVGRLLRRISLDELPNLVNVLRGEMAIVGPRATLPAQTALYTERQLRRLELRPGVTGWAQVHGRAGIPWEERIELDVWYVEHRSLRLDLRILARTPGVLVRGEGQAATDAYAGSSPESPLRRAAEREAAGGNPARDRE
jgi:lipopolysaccharide/colanic/teichoic acid biosynthesis glycosyltransferase